jgi:hypothetical protein
MEKKFRKGEVVWAKVRGFPWWPGVIRNISQRIGKGENNEREMKIMVNFVGDNSHADLPLNKIEKFTSKFEEYSNTKHKGLLNSINIAKKIYTGEIPFEKHLMLIKKNDNVNN